MKISITSPTHMSIVGRELIVKGKVTGNKPVQLYILADDNKWYLQEHTVYHGSKWATKCYLGTPESTNRWYVIAAVVDNKRPHSPVKDINHTSNYLVEVTVAD